MTPEAIQSLLEDSFAPPGAVRIDPPSLMPATVPLEVSGEAVRARLCVFQARDGSEVALRPDLTLPVAVAESERLAGGGNGPRVYAYCARAFRLPSAPGEPMEFTQMGFERFGEPSEPGSDVESFQHVLDAVRRTGAPLGDVMLGDLRVFPAFVDALALSPTAGEALKRAFRQQGGVDALLDGPTGAMPHPGLAAQLAGKSREDARALVEDILQLSGTPLVGARGIEEIAERLAGRGRPGAEAAIPAAAAGVLRSVLQVKGEPTQCLDALDEIARSHGLDTVAAALENLGARNEKIVGLMAGMPARFDVRFGRRFNYYDGFVFELFAPGATRSRPCAAGGRYDGLISELTGGAASATAIGGVVRPDRLALALEAAA